MAYAVKDTQQVYVGYKTATTPTNVGDVKVITDAEKGISIQFVNAKSEVIRTDIIKNGQVKYIKAKVGTDLNDKLYSYTAKVDTVVAGGVHTMNIVVPDFYPTNAGAVKTITATYLAKSSDTADDVAAALNDSLQNHNDYGMVFTSSVSGDTITVTEVFYSSLFKLGVTPVANLIKKLKITEEPVYDKLNDEYVTEWLTIGTSATTTSANNYLYKLQEMEWFLNSYKSDMMKHMNDFYDYIVPKPELLITSTTSLPGGVADLATLDIHYEELGDGSTLSQKNILVIAPKAVVNAIGNALKTAQGVDYTALT